MTNYNFTVMLKNIEIASVQISSDRKSVKVEKFMEDGIKQPFSGSNLGLERVYSFLRSRCYEDGYCGLKEVLENVGMTHNDPWEWNKITHGVTWEDYFWIKFEGESITWEDVRWRK